MPDAMHLATVSHFWGVFNNLVAFPSVFVCKVPVCDTSQTFMCAPAFSYL